MTPLLDSDTVSSDKTKLVFLHPHFTLPGGAGNVVLECASRLDQTKFDIHILCIRVDPQYKEKYHSLSFVEIGGPLSDSVWFWLSLALVQYKVHRALNRLQPDIIIPQVLPANWWGFIYKRFHREVACLWYCHEPSAFIHIPEWIQAINNPLMRMGAKIVNPLFKSLDRFLIRTGSDFVVANSEFSRKLFERVYGRRADCCIYPGVDLKRFKTTTKKKKYFFMVSRLTKFKNVRLAIEAMSGMKQTDCKLIIGGEGEEKDNLVALTKRLDLTDRVSFIGAVPSEDLPKWFGEAKLVIFTSKNEPFGLVPIEALACGTPVIGINSGGLRETVIHGQNGILLDQPTPQGLADTIDEVLSDTEKYDSLRKSAAAGAVKFTWERHATEWEAFLGELRLSRLEATNPLISEVLTTTGAYES